MEAELRASSPRYSALVQPGAADARRHPAPGGGRRVAADRVRARRGAQLRVGDQPHGRDRARTAIPALDRAGRPSRARDRGRQPSARAGDRRARGGPGAQSVDPGVRFGVQLERKRLLIVPDGALQFVPFAMLPRPGRPGLADEPLVVQHEIVQLPSASIVPVLRASAEGRAAPDRLLAVLADPVLAVDDPRLAARPGHVASPRGAAARPHALGGIDGTGRFERLLFTRQEADGDRRARGRRAVTRGARLRREPRHGARSGAVTLPVSSTSPPTACSTTEHPELSGLVLSLVDRATAARRTASCACTTSTTCGSPPTWWCSAPARPALGRRCAARAWSG